jgi:hypothetical protein
LREKLEAKRRAEAEAAGASGASAAPADSEAEAVFKSDDPWLQKFQGASDSDM